MGAKTQQREEIKKIGAAREGQNVQRVRPPRSGARPVTKTLVSGEKPAASPSPAARVAVAGARAEREAARAAGERFEQVADETARGVRRIFEAGLPSRDYQKAVDLFVGGVKPERAIDAVGGARAGVEAVQRMEEKLGNGRDYYRALDLHTKGLDVEDAIARAKAEAGARAPRPRVALHERPKPELHDGKFAAPGGDAKIVYPAGVPTSRVQAVLDRFPRGAPLADVTSALARIGAGWGQWADGAPGYDASPYAGAGGARRRGSFPQTPSQRRENADDNRIAGGLVVAGLAIGACALAWLFGGPSASAPVVTRERNTQPPPPVKPPAKPPTKKQ